MASSNEDIDDRVPEIDPVISEATNSVRFTYINVNSFKDPTAQNTEGYNDRIKNKKRVPKDLKSEQY